MPVLTATDWDQFLKQYPNTHMLQTTAWGELKGTFEWEPVRIVSGNSGAQVLMRKFLFGFTLAYIPKGPVGIDWSPLWMEIDKVCKDKKAFVLTIEPDFWENDDEKTIENNLPPGFRKGIRAIQPRRTLVVDLKGTQDEMLDRMKQKTRYNIKLAVKKGVNIRTSSDIGVFAQMMQVTGDRDRFGVHNKGYFQRVYDLFHTQGECELLIAEYAGKDLAGLMVFQHGKRAWYLYGASKDIERERMPAYLLQWEAMLWAKQKGCEIYDLWGVPDEDVEKLETEFMNRHEGLWGVYRFKRGFGGYLHRSVDPWEKVYISTLYRLYRWWVTCKRDDHG
jgi:peptidoglycan pentaglycine glycine transferase (the first glycine)